MFKNLHFYIIYYVFIFFFFAIISFSTAQQRGKFNQTVNANGWSGNVEFYAANSSSPQALIIGLHPYQSPAWGIRDMLQQSADNYQAILACPDGPDNTLGDAVLPLIEWCKETYNIDDTKIILTGYSAGGQTTFIVGPQNYTLFRGICSAASSVLLRLIAIILLNKLWIISVLVLSAEPKTVAIIQLANPFLR